MLKSDFNYDLPENLIAQTPLEPRDSSRLMVVDRETGKITHDCFCNIADYFDSGDLLVMNDSKVFPARLFSGSSEVLLLEQRDPIGKVWECIGTRLKKNKRLVFSDELCGEIIDVLDNGNRLIRFDFNGNLYEILEEIGNMPTPPYITEKLQDKSRYNTIYANEVGSAAAPTAGLHFTERVFDRLAEKQIETGYVTLHVGIGTFRPVKCERIEEHEMHAERFFVPSETLTKIRECKSRGNRVTAVGTTSCRTLEAFETANSSDFSDSVENFGSTDIFITPGYKFKAIDSLITNFHLPESTLLMLVSAFLGREKTLAVYKTAIREGYRFFSFGDSMLIL
ncbi:MAG: tRNA preQ1(34) S-adenosylmethionine ribosyltransferase-isomerase QueA [Oscillospiraceae bacterium]|nr:tRNA preQ1(34) S-adenosylmethionine ribosyltransferase-isomerase QueA [Oscillospiraceae bacterium]